MTRTLLGNGSYVSCRVTLSYVMKRTCLEYTLLSCLRRPLVLISFQVLCLIFVYMSYLPDVYLCPSCICFVCGRKSLADRCLYLCSSVSFCGTILVTLLCSVSSSRRSIIQVYAVSRFSAGRGQCSPCVGLSSP